MADARPTILLVGESPPRGAPEGFRPFDCASGTRLARAVGLVDRATLLDHVPIVNVSPTPTGVPGTPAWDSERARIRGATIAMNNSHDGATLAVVALGRKVVESLPVGPLEPMTWRHADHPSGRTTHVLALPHPSGQSQALNTDEARAEYRRALLPDLLAATNVTLRPWHFRLDEPQVVADVALALCPHDPPLAAAALVVCRDIHGAEAAPGGHDVEAHRSFADHPMCSLGAWCRGDSPELMLSAWVRPAGVSPQTFRRELSARRKFAARTLPRPCPADVRAAHGRLVALGVA